MDPGGAGAMMGYVRGMSKTVRTPAYINSAVTFAHSRLSQFFDIWMDTIARANPEGFQHVYEWPTRFQNYSETVGVPGYRLWRHTLSGLGRDRVASFAFRASKRPSPVNPILTTPGPTGKSVREGVHVFVWKAPAMEYGIDIEVTPKLARYLAYVFGASDGGAGADGGRAGFRETEGGDTIVFSQGPVNFVAGGGKMKYNFTNAFASWWSSLAGEEFDRSVRPILESDLIDQHDLDREIRVGNRTKSKALSIMASGARAEQAARGHLMDNEKRYYEQARQRRRFAGDGDEEGEE